MIESIYIQNFKSYAEAELKLAPLTVLIGANASGKSNALEAIRLLSWLAQGEKLGSLQYQVNKNDQVVRGDIGDLARKGTAEFTLGSVIENLEFNEMKLTVHFRGQEGLHIKNEVCLPKNGSPNGRYLYKMIRSSRGGGTDTRIAYNNHRKGTDPQIGCTDQRAIFTQLDNVGMFRPDHEWSRKKIPTTVKKIESALSNILFLDPVPHLMREYSHPSEHSLSDSGNNLSSVLNYLLNVAQEKDANNKYLLTFIRSLPEQDITSIGFLTEPRGRVLLTLTETFGKEERVVDAGLLSDGTLRVLAVAAALLSAPEGSMVVIEEIDNGVHPGRVGQLLQAVEETARRRGLRIIISSHNPALLNALPATAIPNVVFCYRDRNDGWSRLVRMQDVPDHPELLAQGNLGDLVTEGVLEQFVKDYEGAERKKERALAWLGSLRKSA